MKIRLLTYLYCVLGGSIITFLVNTRMVSPLGWLFLFIVTILSAAVVQELLFYFMGEK